MADIVNIGLLRELPQVDALCAEPCFEGLAGRALTEAARAELGALRDQLCCGEITGLPERDALCIRVLARLKRNARPSLRPVINGTGVILHTNLGRACLSHAAAEAAARAAVSYSTLEYDPQTGTRGSRHIHVESLLCHLTGAEAAMAVNNNAGAVLLALSALAKGREVIVSRGELVEIGGSFRVPEVMEQGGAVLREVGTTNKTHSADYEKAIGPDTAALLKVHTSNYRVVGFTEGVELKEIARIAHAHGLPVLEDIGSGLLLPPEAFELSGEPSVIQSISDGADLVTFSGDKLLGGPQAGIIAGRAALVDRLKKHPLARALRVDKMTLAALEVTLRAYLDPLQACWELPVLAMITAKPDALFKKAQCLLKLIGRLDNCEAALCREEGQVGGGSMPGYALPSWAVELTPAGSDAGILAEKLRLRDTPIIGRVAKQRLLLDVRTLFDEDFKEISSALHELFPGGEPG